MQSSSNNLKNINFAHEVMCRKFDHLIDTNKSLDQKIVGLIIFITTIIGLILSFLADDLGCNLFTAGIFILFSSLLILLSILATSNFLYPPGVNTVYSSKSLSKKNINLINQVVADIVYCFNKDVKIQNKKAKRLNLSLFIFIISLVIIFIGILI